MLDASVEHADSERWHDEEGYTQGAVQWLEQAHARNKHAVWARREIARAGEGLP